MNKIEILSLQIDCINYFSIINSLLERALKSIPTYVCIANVHMLMEAYDSSEYKEIINSADLITPDGMPLVWMMRLKGQKNQERVYGPALVESIRSSGNRKYSSWVLW